MLEPTSRSRQRLDNELELGLLAALWGSEMLFNSFAFALFVLGASTDADAQWLKLALPDQPRNPDGTTIL